MKYVPQGFSKTDDFFASVVVYAPEFRNNSHLSLDEAFQKLNLGIDSVVAKARRPEALELLYRCKAELALVLTMFKANVAGEAEQRQAARERLQKAHYDLYLKVGQVLKPGVEIGPDDDV